MNLSWNEIRWNEAERRGADGNSYRVCRSKLTPVHQSLLLNFQDLEMVNNVGSLKLVNATSQLPPLGRKELREGGLLNIF